MNTLDPHNRLLPTAVVLDRVCMSRTELYRKINSGEFPQPVPIGRKRIGFLESEVGAWIEARIALRGCDPAAAERRERAMHAVGGR